MNIYLDTSSLIKLYFVEQGTKEIDDFLKTNQIDQIYLSEIAKVEFNGAIWKKVRTYEGKNFHSILLLSLNKILLEFSKNETGKFQKLLSK